MKIIQSISSTIHTGCGVAANAVLTPNLIIFSVSMFWLIFKGKPVEWIQLKFLTWVRIACFCTSLNPVVPHPPVADLLLIIWAEVSGSWSRTWSRSAAEHDQISSSHLQARLCLFCTRLFFFVQAVQRSNETISVSRSAGKNNLPADGLLLKLEEGSNKWSKASLQVLHGLWSDHGGLVQAQQEAQSVLSISQVRLCQICMCCGTNPTAIGVSFCCRLWRCSGSWGWQWAPTRVGPWTHRT